MFSHWFKDKERKPQISKMPNPYLIFFFFPFLFFLFFGFLFLCLVFLLFVFFFFFLARNNVINNLLKNRNSSL